MSSKGKGRGRGARVSLKLFGKGKGGRLLDAARDGDVAGVARSIGDGCGQDHADRSGLTALHLAARGGHAEVCRYLVETARANVNAQTKKGLGRATPSVLAAQGLHTDICRLLLEHGAKWGALEASACLHGAVAARNQALTELLLEEGADANVEDAEGRSPLHVATSFDTDEVYLLTFATAKQRRTTLRRHRVDEAGQRLALCRALLAHGASPTARDGGDRTPLLLAAGHVSICEALVEAGADVNALGGEGLDSPLHCASNLNFVKLMVRSGADPAAVNGSKETPLHKAAATGKSPALAFLLEQGALVDAVDDDKRTPLHAAAAHLRVKNCRTLLRRGADVNAQDDEGNTPLYDAVLAFRKSSPSMLRRILRTCKLLVAYGADMSVANHQGKDLENITSEMGIPLGDSLARMRSAGGSARGSGSARGEHLSRLSSSGTLASRDSASASEWLTDGTDTDADADADDNTLADAAVDREAREAEAEARALEREGDRATARERARQEAEATAEAELLEEEIAKAKARARAKADIAERATLQAQARLDEQIEGLRGFLADLDLEQFLDAFVEQGATKPEHLQEMRAADMERIGLKPLQQRRLYENIPVDPDSQDDFQDDLQDQEQEQEQDDEEEGEEGEEVETPKVLPTSLGAQSDVDHAESDDGSSEEKQDIPL